MRAFLAGPDEASTTPRSTFLFVGGRFVRDRSLLHALAFGYGAILEKGRYPLATLFIDVPGQELDINVHPQKLEVRFARPQEVYAAVRHVIGAAIARAPWLAAPSARAVRVFTLPPQSWKRGQGDAGAEAGDGSGAREPQLPQRQSSAAGGGAPAWTRSAQGGLPLRAAGAGLRDAPAEARADASAAGAAGALGVTAPFYEPFVFDGVGPTSPRWSPSESADALADAGAHGDTDGGKAVAGDDPLDQHEPFFSALTYIGQLDRPTWCARGRASWC